jgi:hypothetical protein
MREMIISELTQAMQEIIRGFAHILPRIIVLVIIAFVGWVVAYFLKVLLRSFLRLIKFDKLSESAGASQLLSKAALPSATELLSRFVFWVAWLGFILLGVSVLGVFGLGANCQVLPFLAPSICSTRYHVLRSTRRWLFFPRRAASRGERQPALCSPAECFHSHDHHYFCVVHGL